ncbi:diacylglycerol/lipid kinase family protein [Thermoactinomyces mirandus]|nr:diacylglycerol kinase family protein [Thermoactinomyces mirandus]
MFLFVVNTESGKGKGRAVWQKVEKSLQMYSIAYQVWFTQKERKLTPAIRNQLKSKRWRAVVAVGGDGTVNEAGGGVIGENIPFGIIPTGTGNDFAAYHKIPYDAEKALARILDFQAKLIDTAYVNGQPMLGSMGVGLDAIIVDRTNRSVHKKWLGSLSYGVEAIKSLFSFKPQKATLTIDGKEEKIGQNWIVAVVNIGQYGGGIEICPQAETSDGYLDICSIGNITKKEFLRAFPLAYRGRHADHPAVSMKRGQTITISGMFPLLYHVDGEIMGTTPVRVEIQPGSLLLL